jgi:signal transduction histidine kinase
VLYGSRVQLSPWICAFLVAASGAVASGQTSGRLLTNAADVISLPAETASRFLKVLIQGVVTASDPALHGRFFVQDDTGGVFVDNANGSPVEAGQRVEVSGITYPGAYAPTVTAPQVRVLGTGPMPAPHPVSIEQLMSGTEDSQRIEISGVVRDARLDGARLVLDLGAGGYRFRAYATAPGDFDCGQLIGSQVRVRGTAAEAHNRSLRQLIAVEVYVPHLTDLTVEKPEPANPFDRAVIPLGNLAQYRRNNSLNQRVHVRGVVTLQRHGESVFLQDELGGLQIQSRQSAVCTPGETVEAVGFPAIENYHPVLQNAVFRKTEVPRAPLGPKPATIAELQNGLHHSEYVSLDGKVIERTVRQASRTRRSSPETIATLVLQTSNFTYTAQAEDAALRQELDAVPIGSVVRVSGICLTDIDSDGKLRTLELLLGEPGDVRIVRKPGWWTPRRLLIGFVIVSTVSIVFASWTIMVSRKNSVLNFLVAEREKAQRALVEANDQLEQRVKERTEQLKFEIGARKESEVQFKAVLAERTRLAQELHDTVEQTLAGISLQLDTASRLHARNPDNSLHHLELARTLIAKSQGEVRQSVWDLRSRALAQFDLSKALTEGSRQITAGTNIQVRFESVGAPRLLPEVVEENLLRIAQEALANVIKHSGASGVKIQLEFGGQQVALQISDDGAGFDPETAPGSKEGHFGLLGMSERAKRLGGSLMLSSVPGQGTVVRVEIPLAPASESSSPSKSQEAVA